MPSMLTYIIMYVLCVANQVTYQGNSVLDTSYALPHPQCSMNRRRSLEYTYCRSMACPNSATAPYFYGSILLQALKSKIIVVLT